MTKKAVFLTSLYSALMLTFLIITVICLKKAIPRSQSEPVSTEAQTEYIYVYIDRYAESTSDQGNTESEHWIMKNYDGRIGIFSADGKLLDVLDVYANTLPQTDQRMLQEGIKVYSKSELTALIEDYTG